MSKDNTVEEIILDICKRDGYSDAEANDVLAVFYSEPAIVEALTTYAEQVRREERERLSPWLDCDDSCILKQFEAGRPTENGGYEVKVNGKWYQTRPVDKSPKCDCGLEEALSYKSV